MTFGLTPQGFKRKTYTDIIADAEARAKSLFGEDINLSERSPMGLWIRLHAWENAKLWELAEQVYNAGYKDTAEGVSLHHVGKYIGIAPKLPEKATLTSGFIVSGEPGSEVPLGFIIGTKDGILFTTTQPAEVGAYGNVDVPIECTVAGKIGNVSANTITEIIQPKSGITSVTNTVETSGGKDIEADDKFKIRYDLSVSKGGSSTASSIEATLLELPTVQGVIVDENYTMDTVNGVPPKSIAPFVFGGDDNEIAQEILRVKAGGIQSYGDTVIQVTDSRGKMHNIGFSRPTVINIYARITLTTDSNYPSDGNDNVRTEVIKYIGGIDIDGSDYDGLGLDRDVYWIKIIAIAQAVPGIVDMQVELSADGLSYSTSNITISSRELARTSYSRVVVS